MPTFAAYLLQHHLPAFTAYQLQVSRQMQLPLLKQFGHLDDEALLQMGMESNRNLLHCLAQNKARPYIDDLMQKWRDNQLPGLDRNNITAEDLTLNSYVRKKVFLKFLPGYCQQLDAALQLIGDIDAFITAFETANTDTFLNLLHHRIDEGSHFIQQINNTMPGAIYVFDLVQHKGVYHNNKLKEILGYAYDDLDKYGPAIFTELVHPEDLRLAQKNMLQIHALADGQINSYKFRVKQPGGPYRWIRLYESVFKRNGSGQVTQTIAIALNVDREKRTADQLAQREHQLLEAQDIAQIGSFVWDIEKNEMEGTPKLYQLLEVPKDDHGASFQKIHPDDMEKLRAAYKEARISGHFESEFRYHNSQGEKVFWSKAVINYNAAGEPAILTGTLTDITERSRTLENLRKSEKSFKQAEALAHIGNFTIDLLTNQITMSDELFRIYGLEPRDRPIDYNVITRMRHPDDRQVVADAVANTIKNRETFDFYFRIISREEAVKIVRARGEALYDNKGEATSLIGTIQDVTEKQQLIEKLRQSEYVYKQAEAMANMGNYTMNALTGQIEWTDQLYIIYELEPQSEKITEERFYAFIHPDDRADVKASIDAFYKTGKADYTFRIITPSGKVKTLRSIAQLQKNEKGQPVIAIGTEQDVTEHRQLVSSLQKSQWLSRQAQSIARLGNWNFHLKTGETFWSEELYSIYELPATEKASYDLFISFIHPDDKEEVVAYYQDCIKNKRPYNKRHRIVLRNGKIKMVHRKGDFRLDADGQVEELFGTTQDITEQQAVENELRENRNFIQKIADATPSIIASYNVNTGRYVFINEGIRKLLDYSPDEVMEKGMQLFKEIIHPDDLPAVVDKKNRMLKTYNQPGHPGDKNVIVDFTYRLRHRAGHYRWFQTYGTIFDRNSNGLIEHILNISLDITDQVTATEKIKAQEHFIQQIADSSPTVLYLYNAAENRFGYINREVFYVLGYTADEIIKKGAAAISLLYHPEDYNLLPERRESTKKFQHTNSMMQYECRMRHKDGNWCWVLVREVLFKIDDNGNVLEILGAALDITRRKEMERTLLQNAFQLEQSNASLEEFAYVASHDLKEPLRKISTFGDRLLQTQQERLNEEGQTYLKKIIDASQRMQLMISDLLSISMITGDRGYEPFSLQTILNDVLQTLEYKIEQKGALIQAEELPTINMIPSQFRQLFQNLLSNSLKFVREGVQPVITITHTFLLPHEVDQLQLAKAEAYLKLQFTDNGIGFEEEYAAKIFAIFQRLHGRSEYEGTGIGLAICKKIVEHHGGYIYASAEEQKGATFTIVLPV